MTRILSALALCASLAAAQNPRGLESFDLSGIKGNGASESTLRKRAASHHAGDLADASALQRDIAAYYWTHGDTVRAKVATSNALRADSVARLNAKPSGEVKAPSFGEEKAPSFGSVKAPSYGNVNAPKSGVQRPPATKPVSGVKPAKPSTPSTPKPETTSTPKAPVPGAFTKSFYHMDGPSHQEQWDFLSDGTYLHTTIGGGAGVAARSSERGTYTVTNGVLEVHVTKKAGASTTTVTGGDRTTMTGSTAAAAESHTYKFKLLGKDGADGMELDGVTYKVKNW